MSSNDDPNTDSQGSGADPMAPLDRLLSQARPLRFDPDDRDDAWELVTFIDEAHQLGLVANTWGRVRGFEAETDDGKPGLCLVFFPKDKAFGVAIEPVALARLLENDAGVTDEGAFAFLVLGRVDVLADGLAAIFDGIVDLGEAGL